MVQSRSLPLTLMPWHMKVSSWTTTMSHPSVHLPEVLSCQEDIPFIQVNSVIKVVKIKIFLISGLQNSCYLIDRAIANNGCIYSYPHRNPIPEITKKTRWRDSVYCLKKYLSYFLFYLLIWLIVTVSHKVFFSKWMCGSLFQKKSIAII